MSEDRPNAAAPAPLRVGPVAVHPPLFLAPMAGVTDRDFRLIIRRISGVGVVSMEFISSKAIMSSSRKAYEKTRELMHFVEEERPLAIQIYGSEARTMADAARVVEDLGADICDINMGCPANKVLKGCSGCALMGDLELAEDIITQCSQALTIPLTVKFRLGINDDQKNYLELGRICQDQGVAAVAMHGRTAKQMFTGKADWSHIARLKEALDIPVIGNGDVREPDDAIRMFEETGCDAVMVGRGATRNPWIFKQIEARMSGGAIAEPTLEDRRDLILGHFKMVADREASTFAIHKLRKFTGWYTHGLPHGKKLRQRIQHLPDVPSFLEAIDQFFEEIPRYEAEQAERKAAHQESRPESKDSEAAA